MDLEDVVISGVAHTPFGKLADETTESLVVAVVREALEDAGVDAKDVDEVFLAQFNAGMQPLAFPSSLVLQADEKLWGKPVTRVENACASGSAAVQQGVKALHAGASTVLVVGVEKMTDAGAAAVGRGLLGADYEMAGKESSTGFAGLFANVAQAYAERYGDPSEALAVLAAKSHSNAMNNPWAHLHKEYDVAFCNTISPQNPLVAAPLRRTDCSPVSDGAAALVLQREDAAINALARLRGLGHANDYLPANRRDPLAFAGSALAVQQALAGANLKRLQDVDFAEIHDCFTIAELVLYEALGLASAGAGRQLLDDGTVLRDGSLPVNVSGGLKSKGHPVGATGVSQHVLVARQLAGRANGMQLAAPRLGLVHNMGGLAVANYATVLAALN